MSHSRQEDRRIELSSIRELAAPELRSKLESTKTRAYGLVLLGQGGREYIDELYASFLHRLAGPDYLVFVEQMFLDGESREGHNLAEQLSRIEPSVQAMSLPARQLKKQGLSMHKAGDWYEIALSTNRRDVFELLLRSKGSLSFNFGAWIFDVPEAPFPLDTLRRLNLSKQDWDYFCVATKNHAALVQLREYHGPAIFTVHLSEEHIASAALATARDIGITFISRLVSS